MSVLKKMNAIIKTPKNKKSIEREKEEAELEFIKDLQRGKK